MYNFIMWQAKVIKFSVIVILFIVQCVGSMIWFWNFKISLICLWGVVLFNLIFIFLSNTPSYYSLFKMTLLFHFLSPSYLKNNFGSRYRWNHFNFDQVYLVVPLYIHLHSQLYSWFRFTSSTNASLFKK